MKRNKPLVFALFLIVLTTSLSADRRRAIRDDKVVPRHKVMIDSVEESPSRAGKLKVKEKSPRGIVRPSLNTPDLVLFFTSEVRGEIDTCG